MVASPPTWRGTVSVIVPTEGRGDSLIRLLRTLGADRASPPLEVLVVADRDHATAAAAVASLAVPFPVRVLEQRPSRGAAVARNLGASHAIGDLLLFIDDDIEPTGDVVAEHRRLHDGGPRAVIGAPRPRRSPDPGFRELAGWAWWERQFERLRTSGHRFGYDDVFTGVLSMPLQVWQSIGGFDDSLRCREDFELGLRLVRRRIQLVFSEEGGGWHHGSRTGRRLVQRKHDEGAADVAIARIHPWAFPALPLARLGLERRSVFLMRAVFDWPRLSALGARSAERLLDVLEAFRMRRAWRRVQGALMYMAYWRGAMAALGSMDALDGLAVASRAATVPDRRELELDLADDPEAIRHALDEARPDVLRLRVDDVPLGSLGVAPGLEPWRAEHLRDPPAALLRALVAANAVVELRSLRDPTSSGSTRAQPHPPPETWLGRSEPAAAVGKPGRAGTRSGTPSVAVGEWEIDRPFEPVAVAPDVEWVRILVRAAGAPVAWRWFRPERGIVSTESVGAAVAGIGPALARRVLRMRLQPEPDSPPPPISVVICTRDRSEPLARCLESVSRLSYPSFEVVLVDNAPSTDATRQLARHHDVRYVEEPIPGLNWARNRGIAEARYDIIAFTDDDVRVDPQWLHALARAFSDAAVGLVTGFVAPGSLDTEAEQLFELAYGGMAKGFAARTMEPSGQRARRLLTTQHLGVGANMAFRRTALAQVGGFDTALDVGTPSHGAGDLDIFFRVLAAGHSARYAPSALVWHYHRATLTGLRRQLYDNGRAFGTYLLVRLREGHLPRRAVVSYATRWIAWLLARVARRHAGELLPSRYLRAELWGAVHAPYAYLRTYGRDRKIRRAVGETASPSNRPAPRH